MDSEGKAMQIAATAPGAGAPSSASTPAVAAEAAVSNGQTAGNTATHAGAHGGGGGAEGCTSVDGRIYPRWAASSRLKGQYAALCIACMLHSGSTFIPRSVVKAKGHAEGKGVGKNLQGASTAGYGSC
eukprot:scaffold221617_cov16-Tisochrysis_lutea.AAC.1